MDRTGLPSVFFCVPVFCVHSVVSQSMVILSVLCVFCLPYWTLYSLYSLCSLCTLSVLDCTLYSVCWGCSTVGQTEL